MSEPFVATVVVLFHPEPEALLAIVRAWLTQTDRVICVDNGGEHVLRGPIEALAPGRVRYVGMPDNLGLGAAHNRGIAAARDEGCTHVVLSDQDSMPGAGMVAELLRIEQAAIAAGASISAVGPRYVDNSTGRHSYFVRCGPLSFQPVKTNVGDDWVVSDFLISSGSLIRMSVLDEIGLMDEGLFIDMVDTDWFLRANQSGRVAVGACRAWMEHALGERTMMIRLRRVRTLPVHKPFRYYYMFRNSLVLYRRPYAHLGWIVPDVTRLLQIAVFFGLFHRGRAQNLRMIARGIVDGIRGVSGRLPG